MENIIQTDQQQSNQQTKQAIQNIPKQNSLSASKDIFFLLVIVILAILIILQVISLLR
jgi:uncharacterized membrane protein